MIRVIQEEEPSKPSTRLCTDESLPSLAALRQIEPKKLMALLRGELDWVVMKCLEKRRDRRYETANGLARDIQRYLADEVVEARPPSTGYRLRKFARRHKGQVIAASLVLFALLAGITGTSLGLVRAEQQRQFAEEAQSAEQQAKLAAEAKQAEAERQKSRAEAGERLADERRKQVEEQERKVEAEKQKVEEEKRIAQAVRDFLENKLLGQTDTLTQADTLLMAGESSSKAKFNPTIRELLDRAALELAADKIETDFPKQPLLQAELLDTVGTTYYHVGEYDPAMAFLARAADLRKTHLGADHPLTLATLDSLALVHDAAGKLPQAIELLEHVRDVAVKKLPADHPQTISAFTDLAGVYLHAGRLPEAVKLAERVRDIGVSKLGAGHRTTLTLLNNLAHAYLQAGELSQAIEMLEVRARR